jgi:protein SCO1/2
MTMTTKSPLASYLLLGSLLVAALLAGAYLWRLGDGQGTGAVQTVSGEAEIGGPFTLTDQNGMRVSDTDFRGRHMLVFFGFTYCPDICPTTLSILSAALEEIGPLSDQVVPILISVDPARDTPEVMKPYLSAFGEEFVGLTGTKEEIDDVVAAYRAYYQMDGEGEDYMVNHSTVVYLMDENGVFLSHYALDMGPDAIAADLTRRLSGDS